ncbi:MAG: SDR family oxidoreductase [Burkholderiales bacterium]
MDLGIRGRKALVCAASKGLGKACAMSLAREGVELTITARGRETLEAAAAEIRKATGAKVTTVAGDIATEEGRNAALAACPKPDILINNAGGPAPGDFRSWTRDDWINALDANMLAPIELIRRTIDHMTGQRFGRIVNITSGAVKHPIDVLGLSNGARTGLTGFCSGISRQVAKYNVTINSVLPGFHATERMNATMAAMAQKNGISVEQMTRQRIAGIPAERIGDPGEFGDACAYLCSAQAGFIIGQNLLLDGGAFPGTF